MINSSACGFRWVRRFTFAWSLLIVILGCGVDGSIPSGATLGGANASNGGSSGTRTSGVGTPAAGDGSAGTSSFAQGGNTDASGGATATSGGTSAGGTAGAAEGTLAVYPAPDGITPSDIYSVTVIQGGVRSPSFVYKTAPKATKSYSDPDGGDEFRTGWTSSGAPYRSFSWTSFAFTGAVTVEVTLLKKAFKTALIRPTSPELVAQKISANTVQFKLTTPGAKVSVEFDGVVDDALLIFADPPEPADTVLSPTASGVFLAKPGTVTVPDGSSSVYFGPGTYDLGRWHLPKSVARVYLAGGAFVYGSLDVDDRPQFSLTGRGILSGHQFVWRANRTTLQHTSGSSEVNCWTDCMKLVELWNVGSALIDGVTLLESPYYYLYPQGSTKLDMHRFKILGSWTWNTDGPEVTDGGTVDDCFTQTNDDMFKLYHSNATVRHCVTWHMHNGGMFQMGWTTHTFSNVTVSDIDAIHTEWRWSQNHNNGVINFTDDPSGVFKPSGSGQVSKVSFSDIRVEGTLLRAVGLYPFSGMTLSDFSVTNLTVEKFGGDISPLMAIQNDIRGSNGGRVQNVAFKNMTVGGELVTQDNAATLGKFVIDSGSASWISFSP